MKDTFSSGTHELRKKSLVLAFVLLQSFFNDSSQGSTLIERVDLELQRSLEQALPFHFSSKATIPKFLKNFNSDESKIQVTFPSGTHSERLIAQVWIETADKKKSLVAIPVQITSDDRQLHSYSLASHE